MRKLYLIDEASRELGVEPAFVVRCIEAHWVRPATAPQGSQLDDEDVARLRLIHELIADLGANDEAVPIILHLLDQVYYLRHQIETRLVRKGA